MTSQFPTRFPFKYSEASEGLLERDVTEWSVRKPIEPLSWFAGAWMMIGNSRPTLMDSGGAMTKSALPDEAIVGIRRAIVLK